MKLTTMEKKFMNAMRDNEYNDSLEGYDGTNFNRMLGCGTWTFTAIDNSGLTPKQCTGVMSSLTKKGLIDSEQVDTKRLGDEDSVWFTEEGAKLFIDADGEKCQWGGFRLLKIEEDTPKDKKTSNKPSNTEEVSVQMFTFTGMEVPVTHRAILDREAHTITVTKNNGEVAIFDTSYKVGGYYIQSNAKNAKFANKLIFA